MKKEFTVFHGMFLLFLAFKMTNTGGVQTWWEVFSPFAIQFVVTFIDNLFKIFNLAEKIKFYFWKIGLHFRLKKAAQKAKDFIKKAEAAGKAK